MRHSYWILTISISWFTMNKCCENILPSAANYFNPYKMLQKYSKVVLIILNIRRYWKHQHTYDLLFHCVFCIFVTFFLPPPPFFSSFIHIPCPDSFEKQGAKKLCSSPEFLLIRQYFFCIGNNISNNSGIYLNENSVDERKPHNTAKQTQVCFLHRGS